jgi:hypothetical protein
MMMSLCVFGELCAKRLFSAPSARGPNFVGLDQQMGQSAVKALLTQLRRVSFHIPSLLVFRARKNDMAFPDRQNGSELIFGG